MKDNNNGNKCRPFQDFRSNQFFVPLDNGKLLGSGVDSTPCSFTPTSSLQLISSRPWPSSNSSHTSATGWHKSTIDLMSSSLPSTFSLPSNPIMPYDVCEKPKTIFSKINNNVIPITNPAILKSIKNDSSTITSPPAQLSSSANVSATAESKPRPLSSEEVKKLGEANRQKAMEKLKEAGIVHDHHKYQYKGHYSHVPFSEPRKFVIDSQEPGSMLAAHPDFFIQGQKARAESWQLWKINTELVNRPNANIIPLPNQGITTLGVNYFLENFIFLGNLVKVDFSGNKIGDEGAKLLADSLEQGKMGKLKVLSLNNNEITDTGVGYLAKVLQSEKVQDMIIHLQILAGPFISKKEYVSSLKYMLNKAEKAGIDTKNIVVDKSFQSRVTDVKELSWNTTWSFAKCVFVPTTVTEVVTDGIVAKAPKILANLWNKLNAVTCYTDAVLDSYTSELGAKIIKTDLEVLGVDFFNSLDQ